MAEANQAPRTEGGSSGDTAAAAPNGERQLREQIEEQQRLINELLENRAGSGHVVGDVVPAQGPKEETPKALGTEGASAPSDSTPFTQEDASAHNNPLVSSYGDPNYSADVAYARHLQELEMITSVEVDSTPQRQRMEDPVWGVFEASERGFRPHQVLCISMCPCCVRPCCSDERRSRWRRVVRSLSFILAALQVALLLVSLFFRGFAPTAVNPMLGPWPDTLDVMGAKNAAKIIDEGQVHRFATPMLLHAGIVHLFTNVVMQLRLGLTLEFWWGWKTYSIVYVLAGLYSGVMSTWFIPGSIGVGASGALMGLMGAWLVDIIVNWSKGTSAQRHARPFQLVMCFVNVLIVLGFSMVPYIDWAAHAGGLLGGALVALWVMGRSIESVKQRTIVRLTGLLLYSVSLVVALILIFTAIEPDKSLLHICEAERYQYPEIEC